MQQDSIAMKIRLSIDRDLTQVGTVGECVRLLCERDIPGSPGMELMLAELLTNIIEHSAPDVEDPVEFPVRVTVVVTDDLITLSVSEVGRALSHEVVSKYTDMVIEMPANDVDIDDLPESGWGMQLIKSICDDIRYERVDGSNVFHLCFDLNSDVA